MCKIINLIEAYWPRNSPFPLLILRDVQKSMISFMSTDNAETAEKIESKSIGVNDHKRCTGSRLRYLKSLKNYCFWRRCFEAVLSVFLFCFYFSINSAYIFDKSMRSHLKIWKRTSTPSSYARFD